MGKSISSSVLMSLAATSASAKVVATNVAFYSAKIGKLKDLFFKRAKVADDPKTLHYLGEQYWAAYDAFEFWRDVEELQKAVK